jgi:hypothetical protein
LARGLVLSANFSRVTRFREKKAVSEPEKNADNNKRTKNAIKYDPGSDSKEFSLL